MARYRYPRGYTEIASNINISQSSAPIYLSNFLKCRLSTAQFVMKDGLCLYFGVSSPLLDDPFPAPCSHISSWPCLSDPEVSHWVTLSPVVWLTKIMPCPEQHQTVLSSETTLQWWLCFDDPLQQQQQWQQFLLIQSNSFSQMNAACTN